MSRLRKWTKPIADSPLVGCDGYKAHPFDVPQECRVDEPISRHQILSQLARPNFSDETPLTVSHCEFLNLGAAGWRLNCRYFPNLSRRLSQVTG